MLGQAFIMKALDEDIIKNENPQKEKTLELTSKEAYGPRKKELLKVFPKSAFDEQQMRPVVGVVYDFNGTYGTVKSVNGGRIMVDFNNPLAGKDIKVVYKVNKKVEDIKEKIAVVFDALLRIPQNMFKVETKEKDVTLKLPAQLIVLKDHIIKTLEDYITEAKDYKIKIEALDEKQN